MAELTIEQQKALVLAKARLRVKQSTAARQDISASLPNVPVGNQPMSWGEVGQKALENTPSSAVQFGSDMVQPFLHPVQTAQSLSDLVTGGIENAIPVNETLNKIGLGRSPETVNREKELAGAVGSFYKDRYGSMEGFKRAVASDPVGVMGDVSTVLTGGGTAAAKVAGAGSKTARALNTAARVTNPLIVPTKAIEATGKITGGTAKAILGATTGTSGDTIGEAFQAGRAGGKQSKAFLDNLRGKESQEAVIDEARAAVGNIADARGKQYQQDMAGIKANRDPMDFKPVEDTFQALVDGMFHEGHAAVSKKTVSKLRDIGKVIDEWSKDPKMHNAIGFDILKRRIDDMMPAFGDSGRTAAAERAVTHMRNSVKSLIVQRFPEYAEAMKNFETSKGIQREIEKSLSLGKGNTADQTLRKLQSLTRNNVNTNYGARAQSAKTLADAGADTLMPKLAGQAMNTWVPRGLMQPLLAGGLAGGAAVFNPAFLAGLPLASPRLVGEATRGLGALAKGFDALPKPTIEQLLLLRSLGAAVPPEEQ
jgi:hypothetical protein